MTAIHLIRHAKAKNRLEWSEPDELRPLTKRGRREARALAERIASEELARLVSSPYLRCVQTLEPLAVAVDLPIETTELLAEGADGNGAVDLLLSLVGAYAGRVLHTRRRPLRGPRDRRRGWGAPRRAPGRTGCERVGPRGRGRSVRGRAVRRAAAALAALGDEARARSAIMTAGLVDAGILISSFLERGPASIRSTETSRSSVRRAARTPPAVPPPTMTTSCTARGYVVTFSARRRSPHVTGCRLRLAP